MFSAILVIDLIQNKGYKVHAIYPNCFLLAGGCIGHYIVFRGVQ